MKGHVCMVLWVALLAVTTAGQAPAPARREARVSWATEEGKPIDARPTEKKDNVPAFPEQTRAPFHATPPYKVTTLIDNLEVPWSLAFLPSGNIILTERLPGRMRMLRTNGTLSGPLAGVSVVALPGAKDIGLLDVVLDPNFASNQRIFFSFFNYIDGTNTNTCIARARLDEKALALTDVTVIFRALPVMPSKRLGAKTGGRIVIGPDGNLLMTLGDRSDSPPWDVAQKLDNHLGKIIRITPDGAPAPDNPFIGKPGVLPEIWAYGMRSPEGLAFDPRSGRLWQNDHGPRGGDELNIVEKGKNYGWPLVAHGIDYPGATIGVDADERHGRAGLLLGSGHRPFGSGLLHRQPVSAVEEQHFRRRAARHDARSADDRERQGRCGRTIADGSAYADSGCSRGTGRRGLCSDRQRNTFDEREHSADQPVVEADSSGTVISR